MINRIPNETKRFRISYVGDFLGDFIKTYGINLIKRGLCEIGERLPLHSSVKIPSGFVRARIRTGVTGPTGPTGLSKIWGVNEDGLISSYNKETFQVGPTGPHDTSDSDILSVGDETGEKIETLPVAISGTDIGNIIVSGTGTTTQGAQSFFAPGPLKSIDVNVKKIGSPTDNLIVAIQGDNDGEPDGVDIVTKTIAPADVTTTFEEIELTDFNITLSVDTYWLVFRRTDFSSTNFYVLSLIIGGDNDPYEKGKFLTYDGTWFEVNEESSTSLNLPTDNNAVSGATGWSDPENAQMEILDYNYAYATPPDGVIYSHVWHTLGFTIPLKSVIAGIIVQARGSASADNANRFMISLTKNANDKVGEEKNNFVTTTPATTTHGSKSDLWNTTFTPQEINSNDFGVRLDTLSGFEGVSWRCMFLKVSVYYYEEGEEKYMDAKINISSEFPQASERIYLTTSDDVMVIDSDDGEWYSLWQGILQKDPLNEDYPAILKNLGSGGTLILANENKVHTLIATANSSTEAEENRLIFDPIYYINWLGVTSSAVFIGLRHKESSEYPSQIAYYEPFSDRVRIFSINEGETIGFIKDENCHIIDKKGQMRVFNGQSFQTYGYFPPYHRGEDIKKLPHRNGISVKGDIVKIAWEGQYPDPAGIWVYQDGNLYHRNALSISTEIGALELNEMKAIYEEDVLYSGANLDDGSNEIEGVYVTGEKNSSASVVTSKMVSPEITHTWQDIVLKYRNGEFVVKQKIEPDGLTEGSGATSFSGTWTASGAFTASIESYDEDGSIKVGDEVIVRKGAGAGLLAHITEIDGTSVTVDKITPTTGSFTFSVERWSKVNIDYKKDKLSAKGSLKDRKLENAQFKIELGGTLEEIQVQSDVDKTIKK